MPETLEDRLKKLNELQAKYDLTFITDQTRHEIYQRRPELMRDRDVHKLINSYAAEDAKQSADEGYWQGVIVGVLSTLAFWLLSSLLHA